MHVVEQTAIIEAPMATVMEAINDVTRIPTWATVPGVVENVQGQGVGMTYDWRFEVSGLTFQGKTEVIEQTDDRLITKTTGDIPSIWTINLTQVGRSSIIIQVVVEYALPNSFVEPLVDVVVQRLARPEVANENMRRFKEMVEKRANIVETQAAVANQ